MYHSTYKNTDIFYSKSTATKYHARSYSFGGYLKADTLAGIKKLITKYNNN